MDVGKKNGKHCFEPIEDGITGKHRGFLMTFGLALSLTIIILSVTYNQSRR
jgi:hypothetical protein